MYILDRLPFSAIHEDDVCESRDTHRLHECGSCAGETTALMTKPTHKDNSCGWHTYVMHTYAYMHIHAYELKSNVDEKFIIDVSS